MQVQPPGSFEREVRDSGVVPLPPAGPPVTHDDLLRLPKAARRMMEFFGVVGRPRDRSFRVAWTGRFRRSLEASWLPAEAWQLNTSPAIARVFRMRLRFGNVLPVIGHDTYTDGHGRMLIKALDLVTVQDAHGHEFDVGELVTWLDDAVLFAPSMLLDARVSFGVLHDGAFTVALTDHGTTVHATVYVGPDGAPTDFTTTDRFYEDPDGSLVRGEWSTPVDGWTTEDGRPVITGGAAQWRLPTGLLSYAELRPVPGSLLFDVPL